MKIKHLEHRYRQLTRRLKQRGLREDEYDEMRDIEDKLVEARRRRRPLLFVIDRVFWLFQKRVNNPLLKSY